MVKREDNPTHVEAFVGFNFSEDGTYIHTTVTDYKDSVRNKKFAYRINIPIPEEVLRAAHELDTISGVEMVSRLKIEVIEHEEPMTEGVADE